MGAFVYDKRGTGQSGGTYTQDFSLLADDGIAAMREARRLAGTRVGRIGYQGCSQGGWVSPIAANRVPVDFVIVCYGLAVNVIDEDQEAVEIQLREKGFPAADIANAQSVASAAETIMSSGFTRGFADFDSLRAKYRSAPWYKDLEGDFTFFLMPHTSAKLRTMGAQFRWHTPFYYDPMPALRSDTVPQLWILGGEDYQAPSAETRRRLDSLVTAGRPFTVAYYPRAEHGLTLFENAPDGSRISTSFVAGYFRMVRDFAADGRRPRDVRRCRTNSSRRRHALAIRPLALRVGRLGRCIDRSPRLAFLGPREDIRRDRRRLGHERVQQGRRVRAMRQVCTLPRPEWEQFRLSRLLGRNSESPHKCALQRIRQDLDARLVEIGQQLVLDPPAEASGKSFRERRAAGAPTQERLPVQLAGP